jgi:hypothetical protein
MGRTVCGLDRKFGAPRWWPPPVSIKACIGFVRMDKHLIMYWRIRDIWSPANLVASSIAESDDTLPYHFGV